MNYQRTNRVSISSLSPKYKKLERRAGLITRRILGALRKEKVAVDIYLVSSGRMRFLNRKYGKKDKVTNVMSFEEVGPPEFYEGGTKMDKKFRGLGEMYICPDYIFKKGEDLKRILIHGLLHLFGYKHSRKSDTIRMEKLEEKLSRAIK